MKKNCRDGMPKKYTNKVGKMQNEGEVHKPTFCIFFTLECNCTSFSVLILLLYFFWSVTMQYKNVSSVNATPGLETASTVYKRFTSPSLYIRAPTV